MAVPLTKKQQRLVDKEARERAKQGEAVNSSTTVDASFHCFYLNISGVWLSGTVLDTDDISTIRGSGMALLFTTDALCKHLLDKYKTDDEVHILLLRSAASECLIECRVKNETKGKELEEDARDYLSNSQDLFEDSNEAKSLDLSFLRFTVSLITPSMIKGISHKTGEAFSLFELFAAINALKAREQYVLPNVSIPTDTRAKFSHKNICQLDHVSPSIGKDNTKAVGSSVKARRVFGRARKKDYHLKILSFVSAANEERRDELLDRMTNLQFSHTLGDLCYFDEVDPEITASLTPAIRNKIALIHLDGNKFGQILAQVKGLEEFKDFSSTLKAFQADLLLDLLEWMVPEGAVTPENNDLIAKGCSAKEYDDSDTTSRIRLETLLWGGDEMLFALPAWRAWEAVGVIEKSLRNFELQSELFIAAHGSKGSKTIFPTHSIGLCFANVKTPIRTIRNMAYNLAEGCDCGSSYGKSVFVFNVAIADSVDIPSGDILNARAKMFSLEGDVQLEFSGTKGRAIDPLDWKTWTDRIRNLKKSLPASQVATLLDLAKKNGGISEIHQEAETPQKWHDVLKQRLNTLFGEGNIKTKEIFEQLTDECWVGGDSSLIALSWLRYLEDYILPIEPRSMIEPSKNAEAK